MESPLIRCGPFFSPSLLHIKTLHGRVRKGMIKSDKILAALFWYFQIRLAAMIIISPQYFIKTILCRYGFFNMELNYCFHVHVFDAYRQPHWENKPYFNQAASSTKNYERTPLFYSWWINWHKWKAEKNYLLGFWRIKLFVSGMIEKEIRILTKIPSGFNIK